MKILLVSATDNEIKSSAANNSKLEILISGVGIPSTIYNLTKKLLQQEYDMVIQAGICGSFSNKIKYGEVVVVEQDIFADIGAEENGNFKSLFQLGFDDENKFPFKRGWLRNHSNLLLALPLKKVKGVTINLIQDRKKQTGYLKKRYAAGIESMEGAALHYVCLQQKVEFLQIRSISNKVGERDRSKWKIKKAIKNLNSELIKIVDSLLQQ